MIPIGSRQVLLVLRVWRIRCDVCGSLRWPRLPFVKGKRRYTRRFARFAIDLLHWMTISGVAKVLSVGWDLIKDLHKEYLQSKYKVPPLKDLKYLGIDEFSIRKGHSYMSIFVDLETGRILHAVEGKSGKDIEPFLKVLKRKTPKLKAIAMDMSTSFISAVEQHLPFIPIVFDRYHVLALMNKAIEPLFTIHTMKEQLREFWEKDSIEQAISLLDAWCTDAENSGIKQPKRVATTLMYHSHRLLNYYFYPIPCGPVEGNNKIKTLKRQAYGFRDMAYFKLRLYHLNSQAYSLTG